MRTFVLPFALAASLAVEARQTPAPQMPAGITRTPVLDNATAMIARLTLEPGARESVHTHPFSAVVIQVGPGTVEMVVGDKKVREIRPAGHVEFLAREMPHAAANVGSQPFDVVTVAIKPDRARSAAAPATPAPSGITRTIVLDNDEVRVARVRFAPGARETDHTHPNDLVLVSANGGRAEIVIGTTRETEKRPPGHVWFLPRDVVHHVVNTDSMPVEFLTVTVK